MPQQIVSFLLALFLGVPSGASATRPTTATLARLDVRITTSSEVTGVTFAPGTVVADRVLSAPRGVTVQSTERGWFIRGAADRTAEVRILAAFQEPTRSASIRVRLRTGAEGGAALQIDNVSGRRFTAARLVSGLTAGALRNVGEVELARSRVQFFGSSDPRIRRGDPRKLVLAFYYPWFDRSYDDPTLSTRPSEPHGTFQQADVLAMTRQAAANGIDGFLVSWGGARKDAKGLDPVVKAAERTGTVATVSLRLPDPAYERSGQIDPAAVRQSISDALERSSSPAFLRSGGVPVIFAFGVSRLGPEVWKGILADLEREGRKVRIVGDANANRAGYGDVLWGFYRYDPNPLTADQHGKWNTESAFDLRVLADGDERSPHLFAATVSPGFDAHAAAPERPVVPRGQNGERYAASWDAAFASDPDWVVITSWNEWKEGTGVQPSVAYGDLALRQTATYTARFKARR